MAKLNITTGKALALSPKRLGEMLEPGLEYTGFFRQKAPCCDDGAKRHICVNGTLPTLAAAKDKPELLRFLLDRGHDVNSASQAATEALLGGCPPYEHPQTSPPPHPGALYANARSAIAVQEKQRALPLPVPVFVLRGVTPLAAAIVYGSVDCVRVLLERPGVWTTECPAVSVALALPWRRADADYLEACRLVRERPDGSLRPLALWAVIAENDAGFLRTELAAATYDTAAVREAAEKLLCGYNKGLRAPVCPPALVEKLVLLAEYDPGAFQTQFLRECLAALFLAKQDNARLRALVERFCRGCTVDLSASSFILYSISVRKLASGLDTLCGVCTPALNCDAVHDTYVGKDHESRLRTLLERVRILPAGYPEGLSALTRVVLSTGSLSLLDLALKKGAIPMREPLDLMLPLIKSAPALRARLLTTERPDTPLAPFDWVHCVSRAFPERQGQDAAFPSGSTPSVPDLQPFTPEMPSRRVELRLGGADVLLNNEVFFAMLGNTEALRESLLARPQRYRTAQITLSDREGAPVFDGWMALTPLCAAALAGQTKAVELLLSLGYDANEHDVGAPSLMHITVKQETAGAFTMETGVREVPLSPLLCAVLSGSTETEALLRAHGAMWDMETDAARAARRALRGVGAPSEICS